MLQPINNPLKLIAMVDELWVFECRRLLNIDNHIDFVVQEWTLHIHLVDFKVLVCNKSQENPNCYYSWNRCKGFIIVYAFLLQVAFDNQSGFVPDDDSVFITLVPTRQVGCPNSSCREG